MCFTTVAVQKKEKPGRGPLAEFLRRSYPYANETAEAATGPIVFKIDGQDSQDRSPDFCRIYADVERGTATQLKLRLERVPVTGDIRELVAGQGGEVSGEFPDTSIELPLAVKEVTFLRSFAKAFRRIVGRGGRYENPNWKWVCPRTADSLDRFAYQLMKYRSTRLHEPWRIPGSVPVTVVAKPPKTPSGAFPARGPVLPPSGPAPGDDDIFCRLGIE